MAFADDFTAFVVLHADCEGEPQFDLQWPAPGSKSPHTIVTATCPGCMAARTFQLNEGDTVDLLNDGLARLVSGDKAAS
jgi:hypothetical protein